MNDTAMTKFAETLFSNYDASQIHARNHRNAIVMYSGGMDSTVALWWALDHYENVRILTVNYNQPHVIEIGHAEKIVSLNKTNHRIIRADFPKDFWGLQNHLTRGQACLMTSFAALDIGHEGADIVMGILSTDLYGDCDRNFLDSLAGVLYHDDDTEKIGIATPLRAVRNKTDVIAMGFYYGAPTELTWTCRDPFQGKPCHSCPQCRARDNALESFFSAYGINEQEYSAWNACFGSPFHPIFREPSHDLKVLASAYILAGGLKNSIPCLCYDAPDGTCRIASHIHAADHLPKKSRFLNVLPVSGELDDHSRWEICICEDETIAFTDRLPDIDVIEQALVRKA